METANAVHWVKVYEKDIENEDTLYFSSNPLDFMSNTLRTSCDASLDGKPHEMPIITKAFVKPGYKYPVHVLDLICGE